MPAVPYKVCVVVDREFGDRLAGLERGVPVWIVDTPINKAAAQRLWKERPDENHLTGITTFDDLKSSSPEDMLIAEMYMIDLHHGLQSADPPYAGIEVIGTPLTLKAKSKLLEFGFNEFLANSGGFSARRTEPVA